MSGFLFNDMIFGPIRSRRLGNSLGINLLPTNHKSCTFNCIYCECGWTREESELKPSLPSRKEIAEALETKLIQLQAKSNFPDSITFAGNGEPTIHPEFAGIVDDTIALRKKYFPNSDITVLSNSSMIDRHDVFNALMKVDNNILKLDAGTEDTFRRINKPQSTSLTLERIVGNLRKFRQRVIIQTLFLRGEVDGQKVDNTTQEEIDAWLGHINYIRPRYVMLYPVDRETPAPGLEVVPREELYEIAEKLKNIRIKSSVY
jgi:wyosine [tRNA(Phe)-imidazoG37] synthetase (radical SAM superfamily)